MIHNLNISMSDMTIRMSGAVRAFCEEAKKNSPNDGVPRFKHMADAWVYLVIQGIKTNPGLDDLGEFQSHPSDAFRWRNLPNQFQEPLILWSLLNNAVDSWDSDKLSNEVKITLEKLAVHGLKQLAS